MGIPESSGAGERKMNLNEILSVSGIGVVVLLTLIQIAPIKINPWSALAKAIGRAINSDLIGAVKTVSENVDQNEIDRLRWEILDFSNSCQNGRRHTREEFDHIIRMHEKYEAILKRRNESNGQVDMAYDYIKTLYQKCLIERDFLS